MLNKYLQTHFSLIYFNEVSDDFVLFISNLKY